MQDANCIRAQLQDLVTLGYVAGCDNDDSELDIVDWGKVGLVSRDDKLKSPWRDYVPFVDVSRARYIDYLPLTSSVARASQLHFYEPMVREYDALLKRLVAATMLRGNTVTDPDMAAVWTITWLEQQGIEFEKAIATPLGLAIAAMTSNKPKKPKSGGRPPKPLTGRENRICDAWDAYYENHRNHSKRRFALHLDDDERWPHEDTVPTLDQIEAAVSRRKAIRDYESRKSKS